MQEIPETGVFGCCEKKLYRENVVTVKYLSGKTTSDEVKKEAAMINAFDHDGMLSILPCSYGCQKQQCFVIDYITLNINY